MPKPWGEVQRHRQVFLSQQAAQQFRGFAEAQLRRLQGIGTGKKGQRHELIGAHGYDIKAAMHVIRLLNEGIELMRSGTITLPRPEKDLLITIRTGNYGSLERVLTLATFLFRELEEGEAKSGLPEKVDRTRISELVSDTYLRFWNNSPATPGCQPLSSLDSINTACQNRGNLQKHGSLAPPRNFAGKQYESPPRNSPAPDRPAHEAMA